MELGNLRCNSDTEGMTRAPPLGSPAQLQMLMYKYKWSYDEAVSYDLYRIEGYSHERAMWMLSGSHVNESS
jgi:hypothetical protein